MSTSRQHRPLGVLQVFYSPAFRWMGRRRGEVSAAIAALSLIDLLCGQAQPVALFEPRDGARVAAGWGLLLVGVAIRLWAAGNLRKHAEVTMTGIYRMVRHPLYLATALLYLAYLLCFGDAIVGLVLFAAMLAFVYWPRILHLRQSALLLQLPRHWLEQLAL